MPNQTRDRVIGLLEDVFALQEHIDDFRKNLESPINKYTRHNYNNVNNNNIDILNQKISSLERRLIELGNLTTAAIDLLKYEEPSASVMHQLVRVSAAIHQLMDNDLKTSSTNNNFNSNNQVTNVFSMNDANNTISDLSAKLKSIINPNPLVMEPPAPELQNNSEADKLIKDLLQNLWALEKQFLNMTFTNARSAFSFTAQLRDSRLLEKLRKTNTQGQLTKELEERVAKGDLVDITKLDAQIDELKAKAVDLMKRPDEVKTAKIAELQSLNDTIAGFLPDETLRTVTYQQWRPQNNNAQQPGKNLYFNVSPSQVISRLTENLSNALEDSTIKRFKKDK
jgi:hypothetical protein